MNILSKFEGEIRAQGEAVALDEMLGLLGQLPCAAVSRTGALAHFLSGSEGWREARAALSGTFATDTANVTGLMGPSDK